MSSLFMGEGNEKQRTSLQGAGLSLLSALPAIGSFIGQSIKLTIKGVDIGCTIVKGAKLIGYGGSAIVAGYGAANGAMDMYRKYAINGEKAGWHTFGEVGSVTLQTVGAFSSGSQALAAAGGRWCFTGETLVATREGLKPIEEIREGDYVLSEDAETGEQSYQQVLQTYINESDTLIHVVTGEDEIETTPMHPFYVIGRGFVPAGELAVGDKLKDSEGRETEVVDVWTEVLDEPVLVYNLEVEESHTYYVGAGMVLVHNDCTLPRGDIQGQGEIVYPTEKTFESARNTLVKEMDQSGAFTIGSKEYVGRLETSYGYDQVIGRQSLDGKVRFRLDYDLDKGVHFNFEDFSKGKKNKVKIAIPIDISYESYKRIIDSYNH